jgi:YVTN family beta-propeller protein
MMRAAAVVVLALTAAAPAVRPAGGTEYWFYVLSESADLITLVRFAPESGARVDHTVKMAGGTMGARLSGPHGIAVSPDGRYYFVSTAHGLPYGSLWKYTTIGDTLVRRVELGMYAASVHVSPDGLFAFVANFNFQGDMVPSSVSVVSTADMVEIAQVPTCVMPHGSRLNSAGTKHYSVCMMDDLLVEVDARTFAVSHRFPVSSTGAAPVAHSGAHGGPAPTCSPTWAQPSVNDRHVYVACNKSNEILEVDLARWTVTRRFTSRDGVYNLAVTHDGRRLLATNKRDQSVSVFDVATGTEVARIPTKRRIVHGVAISSDDRFAFVTEEGLGGEPGTAEVIDLGALRSVAAIDVGAQASGVDFWRSK